MQVDIRSGNRVFDDTVLGALNTLANIANSLANSLSPVIDFLGSDDMQGLAQATPPHPLLPDDAVIGLFATTSKLIKNMEKAGKTVGPCERGHHLVARLSKKAEEARQVLINLGIDIDAAINGAALPKDFHNSMHTNKYYDLINRIARDWRTVEMAEAGLNRIASSLLKKAGKK